MKPSCKYCKKKEQRYSPGIAFVRVSNREQLYFWNIDGKMGSKVEFMTINFYSNSYHYNVW